MKNFKQKICSDPACDNIYYVRPQHFKRSIRCPKCQEYYQREKMRNRMRAKREKEKEVENKKNTKVGEIINLKY